MILNRLAAWLRGRPRGFYLLCVLIGLACAGFSPVPVPIIWFWMKYFYHAFGFFVLLIALRWAYPGVHPLWPALICLGLGAAVEVGQFFIPNRSPGLLDLLADAVGIAVGLVVAHWLVGHRR